MQTFRTNTIRDFGCADIARTNLTFIDLYSDSCPPGPTTPERVTTAEEGTKLSTSTLGAVPTMTSKPSTKFEKTAIPITTVATTTITAHDSSSSTGGLTAFFRGMGTDWTKAPKFFCEVFRY